MSRVITEFKQAIASLSSKLQFSTTVVITLALTMGMLIAVFNVNYLLIAKPLPYPDEDRLVTVWIESHHLPTNRLNDYNTPMGLTDLYKKQDTLESQALIYQGKGMLTNHPEQPNLPVGYITQEYLSLLGADYVLGQGFGPQHKIDDKIPEVVISYDAWLQWFQKSNNIIGQVTKIGDIQFKVIGVLSDNFIEFRRRPELNTPQLWLNWSYLPLDMTGWNSSFSNLGSIAKVPANKTIADVEGSLSVILQAHFQKEVASQSFFKDTTVAIKTTPLKDKVIGDNKKIGYLLLAAALVLLFIACANIVNLFLSRAIEKSRTLAIQAAVGAKPKHIFTSMFAESFILTSIAMLLGLLVCAWCFELLRGLAENQLPRLSELTIDAVTIAFSIVISVLLALMFSFLSTRVLNYKQLKEQLQSSGKGSGLQISANNRNSLIIAQVALTSLMLIGTSMLMSKSLHTIQHPVGFNNIDVVTFELELGNKYSSSNEQKALLGNISAELKLLPQVDDVARAIIPPIRVGNFAMALRDEHENDIGAYQINRVDGNYFDVIGLPLLHGKTFEQIPGNVASDINEIILSESAAKKMFGTTDVVGKNLKSSGNTPLKVVGVVGDIFNPYKSNESKGIKVYLDYATWKVRLMVKPTNNAQLTRQQLNNAIAKVAPGVVVKDLTTLKDIYQRLLFKHKLVAWFVFGLSVLALLLAGAGIYGVLSYSTQMRRYELGVRMSLGAKTHTVIQMVMKDNLIPIGIGIVVSLIVGTLVYAFARQHIEGLLQPELLSVSVATGIMVLVAMLACYIPVVKIVSSDPIKALRYE